MMEAREQETMVEINLLYKDRALLLAVIVIEVIYKTLFSTKIKTNSTSSNNSITQCKTSSKT